MTESQRRLLTREAGRPGRRQIRHQRVIFFRLAALTQGRLEFIGHVEMILDRPLVAPGDEDEMLDSRLTRLVHHMLHHGGDRPL